MSQFIDRARILVASGKGGDGAVQWRREKYISAGGPAGGDGARGGSVILVATEDLNTLLDFRFNRKFKAEEGGKGDIKNMHGRSGADIIIRVPVGTVVRDAKSGRVLADLATNEATYTAAKGGRGGRGNARFATATRQTPRFAEPGTPGEERELDLELKLLADVGLAGLPNAGKSSLIAAISAARPKIANYPFTTLEPQLGVVSIGVGEHFVVADIPGLVEGASEGIGLGHDFLRHIERCRLLIHLVDASGGMEGRDPLADFEVIQKELAAFTPELAARPMVVALSKLDLPEAQEAAPALKAALEAKGFEVFALSSATREGLDDLVKSLYTRVQALPPPIIFTPEPEPEVAYVPVEPTIVRTKELWQVNHERLEREVSHLDLEAPEAIVRFHRMLEDYRVIQRLRELGVKDGDTVAIGEFAFDFVD